MIMPIMEPDDDEIILSSVLAVSVSHVGLVSVEGGFLSEARVELSLVRNSASWKYGWNRVGERVQ